MANTLTKLWLTNLMKDERGQDMTEYALIAGMMASMVIAVVPNMISIIPHRQRALEISQIAMHCRELE